MSSQINNFSNSLTGFILSFQMFTVKPQFWINTHPPNQYLHKIAAESHKIVPSAPPFFSLYHLSSSTHPPAHSAFLSPSTSEETEVIRGKLSFPSFPTQIQEPRLISSGTHLCLTFTHYMQGT